MVDRAEPNSGALLRAIARLAPDAVRGGRVDLERLAELLGPEQVEPVTRYGLEWHGAPEARRLPAPARALALRAMPDRSRAFESTRNVLIEGDNLEALHLLRGTYAGAVKMVYIDPPYNARKNFVYQDSFYHRRRRSPNGGKDQPDQREHVHSSWLSMMYPRLALARELLREDGLLFVSIDDRELPGLLLILDELFGEPNREGVIKWRRRHNQPNDRTRMLGRVSEYIVVYARDSQALRAAGTFYGVPLSAERRASYTNPDHDPRGRWTSKPWKVASGQSGCRYTITSPSGRVLEADWMGCAETFHALQADGRIYWPKKGNGWPRKKIYLHDRMREGQRANDFWGHEDFGHNQEASAELAALLGERRVFESPKPVRLLKTLCRLATRGDDLILDFFAGSGTTAHAAWALNAEDGGRRRVLLVQLPEETGRADYPTIPDITRARLASAAASLREAHPHAFSGGGVDVGLRVFHVDEASCGSWDMALTAGIPLDAPCSRATIGGAEVWTCQHEGARVVLLPGTLTRAIAEACQTIAHGAPLHVVCAEAHAPAALLRLASAARWSLLTGAGGAEHDAAHETGEGARDVIVREGRRPEADDMTGQRAQTTDDTPPDASLETRCVSNG